MIILLRLAARSACAQQIRARSTVQRHAYHSAPKIELREYQRESIASVLDYLSRGERRLGLSLATGSGKTVVFSHLIEQVPAPTPRATQTLVLAHRRELVEQAARHCQDVYPNKTIEIEMGNLKASGLADITVASVATVRRRLEKYDPALFKLLIVDEAHHITAPSYAEITSHFGLNNNSGHVALVGVSATFSRADGISLGSAIDHIVYHKDYLEMIDDDYLSGLIITTVQTGVDLAKVKVQRGDFAVNALSTAVNTPATNDLTVRSWLTKAEGRHSTLVFCVDIAHVVSLTETFREHGIDARAITGDSKTAFRAETLKAFREQEFPVLINCGIFTEGTDIPNIDCVLLARPTRSRNLLVQMIGRGLRKHTSKTNCHIIDMVGALDNGIVTAPTLYGLDPNEVLDAADPEDMKNIKEQTERDRAMKTSKSPDTVTFTDYDNVLDFVQDTSGERRLRAISRYAWVEVDATRYILSNHNGDYLKAQPDRNDSQLFEVVVVRKLAGDSKSPFMRPRVVASTATREGAIAAADTFAANNFAHTYILRWAAWRRSLASEGQIKFLNKFRGADAQLEPGSVKKGEASDWITKLRHGSKSRFEKGVRDTQKVAEMQLKEAMKGRVGLQGPIS